MDLQLAGKGGWSSYVSDETQAQSCSPLVNVPGNASMEINPCGLVAWSLFNDSYSVSEEGGTTPMRGDGIRPSFSGREGRSIQRVIW